MKTEKKVLSFDVTREFFNDCDNLFCLMFSAIFFRID